METTTTLNNMTTNLFELTFTDNTKLWASMQNKEICFGTLGKGLNLEIKKLLQKDKNIICYVADQFSKNKNLVLNYIDYVELESIKLQNQLIEAYIKQMYNSNAEYSKKPLKKILNKIKQLNNMTYSEKIEKQIENGTIDSQDLQRDFFNYLVLNGHDRDEVNNFTRDNFENLLTFEQNEQNFKNYTS